MRRGRPPHPDILTPREWQVLELLRDGLSNDEIAYVSGLDGSNKRQITGDPAFRDERPQWSADGSHILFSRLDKEDYASLWLVPSTGGTPLPVAGLGNSAAPTDVALWFGYYGYLDWDSFYDWTR